MTQSSRKAEQNMAPLDALITTMRNIASSSLQTPNSDDSQQQNEDHSHKSRKDTDPKHTPLESKPEKETQAHPHQAVAQHQIQDDHEEQKPTQPSDDNEEATTQQDIEELIARAAADIVTNDHVQIALETRLEDELELD